MRRTSRTALVVLTVAVTVLAACGRVPGTRAVRARSAGPTAAASKFAAEQQDRVTVDAMMAHLGKLQEIADANDGNRALGTPGYDASVDYVASVLRDKGFDVTDRRVRGAAAVRRRAVADGRRRDASRRAAAEVHHRHAARGA